MSSLNVNVQIYTWEELLERMSEFHVNKSFRDSCAM